MPAALCTGELVILSLHDQPEWGRIYTHPNEEFDLEAVTDEVVGVVRKGLEEHPDIGAVVLECTDLPPTPPASATSWTSPCSTSTP